MSKKLSEAYENYLQAIYRFCADREDCIVKTSELAEHLRVKPPSVTEMLDKLKNEGYIVYKKRKGVKLTKKGKTVAERILQSHRIIELFLRDVLRMENVHELAGELEHHITPEMYNAICELLEHPRINGSTVLYFNLDRVEELINEFTDEIVKEVTDSENQQVIFKIKEKFIENLRKKEEKLL
ncbi:MAG: metal-dependent transcriptional regulator [Candidatus Helarchaeota archaeon]